MKILLYSFLTISFLGLFSCQNQNNTTATKHPDTLSVNTNNTSNKSVSNEEAVKLAEDFVRWQGYTNTPTDLTLEEALFETDEFATSIEKLMDIRQNTLQGKAIGVKQFDNQSKWAVAFDFVEGNEEGQCRCVIMDTLGESVYMKPGNTFIGWFNQQ